MHDQRTLEVWYALPNRRGFADWNKWLPLFDAFLNPSEEFRVEVLMIGTLLQNAELMNAV